jgi:simple sugar transport system permease protein
MLTGAFFAVAVSWYLGVAVAMIAGLAISMIMAVGHIKFKADICAIGMGINLFAIAITKFLLNSMLGKRGTFSEPGIIPIPRVHIKLFDTLGPLNELFNNWAVTEWFVIVLIFVLWFVMYKTRWGLHLRAVGQFPMAAQTAGINVTAIKYEAIAISGLIGGLAGAHLSLGYSVMFTENMTNSRGFMGVAAMFFGNADPIWTSLGCFVFGFADSIGNRLQSYGMPSQIVLLMPYVVTVVVLAVSMISKIITEQKRKSSLNVYSE